MSIAPKAIDTLTAIGTPTAHATAISGQNTATAMRPAVTHSDHLVSERDDQYLLSHGSTTP